MAPKRWHSFELEGRPPLDELVALHADARRELAALGYGLASLEGLPLDAIASRLHALLDRSFDGFLAYTPLPTDEFRAVLGPAGPALARLASVFVEGPSGGDAGFAVAFDDVGTSSARSLLLLCGLVPEARQSFC